MRPLIPLLLVLIFAGACGGATRVGGSSGITTDELGHASLIAKVKTALLNDPVVGRRRIDVQVNRYDVILTGRVATAEERDRAVQIASAVDGVQSVKSQLEIRP